MFFNKKKSSLSITEEEQVFSPGRTALNNFLSKKTTVLGMIIFSVIFLSCFILPLFFHFDRTYQDTTQPNISPGFPLTQIPKGLANNAKQISPGSSFAVGIDNNGEVHQWGHLSEKLKNIPASMGRIGYVSAGLDHIVAISESGDLYTWGNDRFNLSKIPDAVEKAKIVQAEAGYQNTVALDEQGNLYVWGNENLTSIIVRDVQGRVEKFVLNSTTAIALLDDDTVSVLTNKATMFSSVPTAVQGNAIDIATTDKTAAALLKDGTVVVWGGIDYGIRNIPQEIQGHVTAISGGRGHFTVLLDDGSAVSWGQDNYGQTNVKRLSNIDKINSAYHQNYAIDSDGKVHRWGGSGYLMGTDQFGRDIFVRLLEGGKITLTIGAIAVVISGVIGIVIGSISGFYGGKIDMILMRFGEVVNAIPFMPLAIILSSIIGSRIPETYRIMMIMVILGVLGWPGLARLTRAQILAERENEFVTAAKAMGIRESIIIFRHILPNVLAVVSVNLTISLASSMITESALSFLGFGVLEPSPTWGNMLMSARDSTVIGVYWWRWIFPSLALGLATVSINLVGDGLRDAIDPKSGER